MRCIIKYNKDKLCNIKVVQSFFRNIKVIFYCARL
jgi:hypothetical protein